MTAKYKGPPHLTEGESVPPDGLCQSISYMPPEPTSVQGQKEFIVDHFRGGNQQPVKIEDEAFEVMCSAGEPTEMQIINEQAALDTLANTAAEQQEMELNVCL